MMKDRFMCSVCGHKPDRIEVHRYHVLRCWSILVHCHGQTELMMIKQPPLSEGAPFVMGDVEVY